MNENTCRRHFEARIKKTKTCWIWTGKKQLNGGGVFYGRMYWLSRSIAATHIAFYLAHGVWPKKQINHICHNTLCVNPQHLYDGTQTDNMRDMILAGRARYTPLKGEKNPRARLTSIQVKSIRSKFQRGLTQTQLAKYYHVHVSTIHLIVRHKTWL